MRIEVCFMLYEIICDKFKQKRVALNTGLNTILGPERGDNSIGKSTFYYSRRQRSINFQIKWGMANQF